MPRCTMAYSSRPRRSFSLNSTRPSLGTTLPQMASSSVVLPAPFGPMTTRSSPTFIEKLSRFSARNPSKVTVKSSARMMSARCTIFLFAPAPRQRVAHLRRQTDEATWDQHDHGDEQHAEYVGPLGGEMGGAIAVRPVDDEAAE